MEPVNRNDVLLLILLLEVKLIFFFNLQPRALSVRAFSFHFIVSYKAFDVIAVVRFLTITIGRPYAESVCVFFRLLSGIRILRVGGSN